MPDNRRDLLPRHAKSSLCHNFRNFRNRVVVAVDVPCVSQFDWDVFDEKEFI